MFLFLSKLTVCSAFRYRAKTKENCITNVQEIQIKLWKNKINISNCTFNGFKQNKQKVQIEQLINLRTTILYIAQIEIHTALDYGEIFRGI